MQRLLRSPVLSKQFHINNHLPFPKRSLVINRGFSTNSQKPRFPKFWYPIGFGVIGLVAWKYATTRDKETNDSNQPPVVIFAEPSTDYAHPYASEPWYWRWYFSTKRFIVLCYIFAPVAAMTIATAVLPDNTSVRDLWLSVLTQSIESAGCSFQKLAQWISMRPDMFPADVVEALGKMRTEAPVHEYKDTQAAFRDAFGCEIEEIFESFNPVPVASGTVAQVHRARLKAEYSENGIRDVAVKVRHPRVLDETWVDLDFAFQLAALLKTKTNNLALPFSQEECVSIMRQQLDLQWEAYNLSKFSENFASDMKDKMVRFPRVLKDLVAGTVLIESWADGVTLDHFFGQVGETRKQITQQTRRAVAATVFDTAMKMFMRDNLVHGDLHAGNCIYSEVDGLHVIDAGLVTRLDPNVSRSFIDFLLAVCTNNIELLADKIIDFNTSSIPLDRKFFSEDLRKLTSKLMGPVPGRDVDGSVVSVGDLVGKILLRLNYHKVVLRGDVAHALNSISLTEGLILQLDPEFDCISRALPYFLKYPLPPKQGVDLPERAPAEPLENGSFS